MIAFYDFFDRLFANKGKWFFGDKSNAITVTRRTIYLNGLPSYIISYPKFRGQNFTLIVYPEYIIIEQEFGWQISTINQHNFLNLDFVGKAIDHFHRQIKRGVHRGKNPVV